MDKNHCKHLQAKCRRYFLREQKMMQFLIHLSSNGYLRNAKRSTIKKYNSLIEKINSDK